MWDKMRACSAALRKRPADGARERYGAFDEWAGDAVKECSRVGVDDGDGRRKGFGKMGRKRAWRERAGRGGTRREGSWEAQRKKLGRGRRFSVRHGVAERARLGPAAKSRERHVLSLIGRWSVSARRGET